VALGVSAAIARLDLWLGAGALSLTALLSAGLLWRGRRLAHDVVAVFDELALELGMLRCTSSDPASEQAATPAAADQATSRNRGDDYSLVPEWRADIG